MSEHATRDEKNARNTQRLAARAAIPKHGYHAGLGADEATPARAFLAATDWARTPSIDSLPARDVLDLL